MIASLITLLLLILIQGVLGLDNLLYISLASKKVPVDKQSMVRKWGIGLAIILRIALLFALMHLIQAFENPLFGFDTEWIKGSFNLHSLIVLVGGIFIIYTAMKEILHMMSLEHDGKKKKDEKMQSSGWAIFWIVLMNIVFSIDSILSAMALTDVFWVMCTAIVIGGLLMIWLAERVSKFLAKNRMYEVLGLFILFVVGIMLVTEGGHLGELELFGEHITPMAKVEFYFILAIIILIDVVQTKYQKKIDLADQEDEQAKADRESLLELYNTDMKKADEMGAELLDKINTKEKTLIARGTMRQAAVCIIENNYGQILILQRSKRPHGFGLPGGKVDSGETVMQAAIREVREETGIAVDISEENKVGVVQSAVKEFEVHVYYHKLDELPNVILSGEHVGYAWTTKPYDGFDLAGNTKKMIKLWPGK